MSNQKFQLNPSSHADDLLRGTPPWPRYLNALLGGWLFISALLWSHQSNAMTNSWVVGALMVVSALWALTSPPVRWSNTALATWLGIATLAFIDTRPMTFWNNLIVAAAVFVISLVPSRPEPHTVP